MAVPTVIYAGKPKKHSWARWLTARTMRKNNNNLISVIGKTGSGKTWSAISICEMMSELDGIPFTVDHIVFSLTELMDLINSGNLKRGSKIVFDEPQCSISAREFQSEANKVFNLLISTFRHRNLTLFFCTPFESLLDKNTRRLFHGRFETMSVNTNTKTCRLKPRFLEYSDFKSEPYRKQLQVIIKPKEKGQLAKSKKVFYWDIPKPSEDLIDAYEEKKLNFTNKLNKNISERLNKFEDDGKSLTSEQEPQEDKRKPLTEKQLEVMRVLSSHKYKDAKQLLNLSYSSIHKHKELAEKKGYSLQEFRENG